MTAALKTIHASLDSLEARVLDVDFNMEQAADALRKRIEQAGIQQMCDFFQEKTMANWIKQSRYYDQKLHLNVILETHLLTLAVALKQHKTHIFDRRLDSLLLRYYHAALGRPASEADQARAAALALRAFGRFPDDPLAAKAVAGISSSAGLPWPAQALRFAHRKTFRPAGLSGPLSLALSGGSILVLAINPPHILKITGEIVERPPKPLKLDPVFILQAAPERFWIIDWVAWNIVELDQALRVVRTLPIMKPQSVRGPAHIGGAAIGDKVYLSIVDQNLWETHLVVMDVQSGETQYLERLDGMMTFHAHGDDLYCTDCFGKALYRYANGLEPLFTVAGLPEGVNMEAISHGKGGFLLYGGEKVAKIDSQGRIVYVFDLSRITGKFGLIQWGGLASHDGLVYAADYFNNSISIFDLGD